MWPWRAIRVRPRTSTNSMSLEYRLGRYFVRASDVSYMCWSPSKMKPGLFAVALMMPPEEVDCPSILPPRGGNVTPGLGPGPRHSPAPALGSGLRPGGALGL